MRSFLRFAAALVLTAWSHQVPAAPEPILIKFCHASAEDSAKGRAVEYFKNLVELRTQGRVRVEVFPNGLLYGEKDELEALQLGAVQMLVVPLVNFSALGLGDFDAFELPYLFADLDAVHKVTQGSVGEALLGKLDAKGMRGLAYWDVGFKQFSANRALRSPADAKGLRLRTKYSRVSDAEMRALGAVAQPTSLAAMFHALQAGHLDGTENPASMMYAEHLQDVQSYLTVSDHGYVGNALVVNLKFWNRLPAGVRRELASAAHDATHFANELARKDAEDSLEAMRRSGRTSVIALTSAEKALWRRALMPVHREAGERIEPEVLHAMYRETGFVLE